MKVYLTKKREVVGKTLSNCLWSKFECICTCPRTAHEMFKLPGMSLYVVRCINRACNNQRDGFIVCHSTMSRKKNEI